jgi:hypothetical protein
MRNFHLPLPVQTDAQIRAKAERAAAIVATAEELAGTELDIDRALEAAGIEQLLQTVKACK